MKKRILALFAACCLIAAALPLPARAAGSGWRDRLDHWIALRDRLDASIVEQKVYQGDGFYLTIRESSEKENADQNNYYYHYPMDLPTGQARPALPESVKDLEFQKIHHLNDGLICGVERDRWNAAAKPAALVRGNDIIRFFNTTPDWMLYMLQVGETASTFGKLYGFYLNAPIFSEGYLIAYDGEEGSYIVDDNGDIVRHLNGCWPYDSWSVSEYQEFFSDYPDPLMQSIKAVQNGLVPLKTHEDTIRIYDVRRDEFLPGEWHSDFLNGFKDGDGLATLFSGEVLDMRGNTVISPDFLQSELVKIEWGPGPFFGGKSAFTLKDTMGYDHYYMLEKHEGNYQWPHPASFETPLLNASQAPLSSHLESLPGEEMMVFTFPAGTIFTPASPEACMAYKYVYSPRNDYWVYAQSGRGIQGPYEDDGSFIPQEDVLYRFLMEESEGRYVTRYVMVDGDAAPAPTAAPSPTVTPEAAPSPAPVSAGRFTDVPTDAPYAAAVQWAVDNNVTNGVTETSFAPDAPCTRGQVATFLWRAAGEPEPASNTGKFTDVSPASPFYKAILWAVEQGITNGTTESTFSPADPCTYAQVLTFLWRQKGQPVPGGESELGTRYENAYYRNALAWADSSHLLNGAAFDPADRCPRSDIVSYLYRGKDIPVTKPASAAETV